MSKDSLTYDLVNELLEYRDGNLYWKERRGGKANVGSIAGSMSDNRINVRINGVDYKAHQIVFLLHHGYVPDIIDHIDGNGFNNSISNLQPVTKAQNAMKALTRSNNTSGYRGVSFAKHINRWHAYITYNKVRENIGYYKTKKEAIKARLERESELFSEYMPIDRDERVINLKAKEAID